MKFNCIHDRYSKPIKIYNNPNEEILLEETIFELEKYAIKSHKLFNQNKNDECKRLVLP